MRFSVIFTVSIICISALYSQQLSGKTIYDSPLEAYKAAYSFARSYSQSALDSKGWSHLTVDDLHYCYGGPVSMIVIQHALNGYNVNIRERYHNGYVGCGNWNEWWYRTVSGTLFPYQSNSCLYPYTYENGQCTVYCPEDKPEIDPATGQCVGEKDKEEPENQCKTNPTDGNPVVISTGEKYQIEMDLLIDSAFPLSISRTYRSNRSVEQKELYSKAWQNNNELGLPSGNNGGVDAPGMAKLVQPSDYRGALRAPAFVNPTFTAYYLLGSSAGGTPTLKVADDIYYAGFKSWRYNFLGYVTSGGNNSVVNVSFADTDEVFYLNGGNHNLNAGDERSYNTRGMSLNKLIYIGKSEDLVWKYVVAEGNTVYFNSSGRISKIVDSQGFEHLYKWHVPENRMYTMLTIFDGSSNSLVVYFNNYETDKQIDKVIASNGITLRYNYDKYGNLTKVMRTTGEGDNEATLSRQYHYENTAWPYHLTGITDEAGIRAATWIYDDLGRATESVHAGGADKTTFEYTAYSTKTTNALGKSTTYHFAMDAGRRRLQSVEGHPSSNCAAANQNYSYYPNGTLKTQTDWQGNVTYFEYNEKGQATKEVVGYGTGQAYEIKRVWHPNLNLPIKVVYPNKVEEFVYDDNGLLLNMKQQSGRIE